MFLCYSRLLTNSLVINNCTGNILLALKKDFFLVDSGLGEAPYLLHLLRFCPLIPEIFFSYHSGLLDFCGYMSPMNVINIMIS